MKIEVRVPTLSDSVASGTLLPWRKQVGETVARDETLVDLETDKVILEIPAPASGTLVELRQPEGAVVKADEVVAVIETGENAGFSTARRKARAACSAATPVTPAPPKAGAPVQKASVPLPAAPQRRPSSSRQAKAAASRCRACASGWPNAWSRRSTPPPCSPPSTR